MGRDNSGVETNAWLMEVPIVPSKLPGVKVIAATGFIQKKRAKVGGGVWLAEAGSLCLTGGHFSIYT